MSYTNKMRTPSPIEKIIAIGSYIFPMVGFVIIIIERTCGKTTSQI